MTPNRIRQTKRTPQVRAPPPCTTKPGVRARCPRKTLRSFSTPSEERRNRKDLEEKWRREAEVERKRKEEQERKKREEEAKTTKHFIELDRDCFAAPEADPEDPDLLP